MKIRVATADDAAPLAMILGDWCAETPYIPPLHNRAEDRAFLSLTLSEQHVWVAEADGAAAGYLALKDGWVTQLYLVPMARGMGAGLQLLDQAKAECDRLNLWCFQANTGARRFYEREGFVAVETTDGADNEEKLPDIRYEWKRPS